MFGPSPPAFTIGNSRRDTAPTTAETSNPGPASYNLTKDLTDGKMTSFPRAKRYRPSTYAGPGPGTYESKATLKKAPQAIVISRKVQSKVDIIPGPGDYSPKKLEKNISYTMRSKSASRSAKDLPGPGSYDPANVKQTPPRATFGFSKRGDLLGYTIGPGPGSYEKSRDIDIGPKLSFSKTPKSQRTTSMENPGPGSYNIRKESFEGSSAIVVPRRPLTAGEEIPGPGAYRSDSFSSSSKGPAFSIGKSVRYGDKVQGQPSPADYTPRAFLKSSPSYSIGSTSRDGHIFHIQKTPGPGAYNGLDDVGTPKYSMRGRPYTQGHTEVPVIYTQGPGQYSPSSSNLKNNARAVFGKGSRDKLNQTFTVPSPWDYSPKKDANTPHFSFGKSPRIIRKNDTLPGPGSYQIPHTVGSFKSTTSGFSSLTT